MKRVALILILILITIGCKTEPIAEKEDPPSKYIITDTEIIQTLSSAINTTDDLLLLKNDEINLTTDQQYEFIYAIKNPTNKTDICIYSQFTCRTVLKGEVCDTATGERNTGYYWRWFKTPKSIVVKNESISIIKADLKPTSSANVFLGQLIVWKADLEDDECPDIHYFNEREGIKVYEKAEFMLRVE